MASLQMIGKMITKLNDDYCHERDHLYREYDLNRESLFIKYVVDRKCIIGRYVEAIERAERGHAQKYEPLDFHYQADEESLNKDICIDHAPNLDEFEHARFEADADLIAQLNKLYKEYQADCQEIEQMYQEARSAAYTKYKAQHELLESEGRG